MLSFEMGSGSGMMVLRASGRWVRILFGPHQFIQNHSDGIVELVDNPFLQRNDRVVRNRDVFRADLGAAFGDVAITDALRFLQVFQAVFCRPADAFPGPRCKQNIVGPMNSSCLW